MNLSLRRDHLLSTKWTTSHVVKVDVDQEEVGLYKFFDPRTSAAYYYECVDPRPNELTRKKILYLYVLENRPDQAMIMVDKYGRQYKKAKLEELVGVTIAGQPVDIVLRPSTARGPQKRWIYGQFRTNAST